MGISVPQIEFIGASKPIRELKEKALKLAKSSETVLIEGETGTGKSLLAKVIHTQSGRHHYAFMDIACGAFSKYLLESELFGHIKGSFTGAHTSRKGKFLAANGGTLFLDEIGDIGSNVQAKLVKVIEEKRFFPVGSDKEEQTDVRLIAATHQPLAELVRAGKFRKDLYFRLNRLSIHIPPLRERGDDVKLLIDVNLKKLECKCGFHKSFSKQAYEKLLTYSWPGNVRELEGVIIGAFLSAESEIIDEKFVVFQKDDEAMRRNMIEHTIEQCFDAWISHHICHHHDIFEEFEKSLILMMWEQCQGNKDVIARKLHISRGRVYRLLTKHHTS